MQRVQSDYLSIMAKKLTVKDQGRRDSEESRNRNAEQSLAMLMIPPHNSFAAALRKTKKKKKRRRSSVKG
jgi:hypothetical protein